MEVRGLMRFGDYCYAAIPSACIALPFCQLLNIEYLAGIEKLGIVGIMAAGILFFAMERRSFILKSGQRLGDVEKRLTDLENQVVTGNSKVITLLDAQLATLREIKDGQLENFARMWQMTLTRLDRPPKPEKEKSVPDSLGGHAKD
jgi:hypothetical protein